MGQCGGGLVEFGWVAMSLQTKILEVSSRLLLKLRDIV